MMLAAKLHEAGLVTTDKRIRAAAEAAVKLDGDFVAKIDAFYAALEDDPAALMQLFRRWRSDAARPVLAEALQRRSGAGASDDLSPRSTVPPQLSREASPTSQASFAAHGDGARRATPHSPDERLRLVANSLLDTFTVNGQPIGKLTPREALGWAGARERDARFVRALCANLPPDAPIATYRTAEDAQQLWAASVEEASR